MKRPSLLLEQLEDRIFFDANPLAPVDGGVDSALEPVDSAASAAAEKADNADAVEVNGKTDTAADTEDGLQEAADQTQTESKEKDPADGGEDEAGAKADGDDLTVAAEENVPDQPEAGAKEDGAASASDPADSVAKTDSGTADVSGETDSGEQENASVNDNAEIETTATHSAPASSSSAPAASPSAATGVDDTPAKDLKSTETEDEEVQEQAAAQKDDPQETEETVAATEVIDPMIGEDFTFTVSLDNNSGGTLYGPYIDLYMPTAGDDGDGDGVSFVSATYLGAPVTSTVQVFGASGQVTHPYAVDGTGAPVVITGTPGDTYVTLEMPFGSFTPDQPAAEVLVTAHISEDRQVDGAGGSGEDFAIVVSNGYRYGSDPLDNPTADTPVGPTVVDTQTFRPEVIRFEKEYIVPELETATGPNYPRQYQVTVDIAAGQTIANLTLTEHLPNEIYYLGDATVSVSGGHAFTVTSPNATGGIFNNGTLTVELTNPVLGTAAPNDVVITFDFYVPQFYADGTTPILNPNSGDDAIGGTEDRRVINDVEVSGDWTPTDADDTPQHIVMDAEVDGDGNISVTPDNDEEFDAEAIAIQKSVGLAGGGDTGIIGGYNPGDYVQYTLQFQISDYFNFGNITIDDILPDGLTFQTSGAYTPTFSISDETGSWSGNWVVGTTLTTTTQADHDTELHFDVSAVAGGVDGVLQGDLYGDSSYGSPARGTITYYAFIKDEYQSTGDSSGPGDVSIDQGDVLTNAVTLEGQIYGDDGMGGLTSSGYGLDQDDSSASFQIEVGAVSKSIYAINGSTDLTPYTVNGALHLSPGDTVTYRLQYHMPTSEFESFRLDDYLPLPVFDAGEVTTRDAGESDTAPAAGHWHLHTHDSYSENFPTELITLETVTAGGENRVSFIYEEHDVTSGSLETWVDILFTVTINDEPFADGLYLTNQAQGIENGTLSASSSTDAIVQIVLDEPDLNITKGAVESSNSADLYSPNANVDALFSEPGIVGFRPGTTVTSAWLDTNNINTNVRNLDAGDTVTFAIVVENTGHAGAFDIVVQDTLPTGFDASILNLSVTDGAGNSLAYAGDLFTGITITDDADGALNAADDSVAGSNILVITYDLTALGSVQPLQTLTNTATLAGYAGAEGANNHVPGGLTDDATVTIAAPAISKGITGTGEGSTDGNNVVIGETITYTTTITVPEGTSSNGAAGINFFDDLDPGLALVSVDSITASAGLATTANGGNFTTIAPTVTDSGGFFSLNFGTITNSDRNNTTPETITVTYTAVVLNTEGNQQDTSLGNRAGWHWNENGNSRTSYAFAPDVTVQEPDLEVVKEVWNGSAWIDADTEATAANYDQGDDNIQYRIIVQHSSDSHEDAFDVVFSDTLPTDIDWSSATVSIDSGVTPISWDNDVTDGAFSAKWDSLLTGQSTTFIVSGGLLASATAGQAITNTGTVTWESLPDDPGQISPYNPLSYERTGDPADPGGAANNYTASDPAVIAVAGSIDKTGSGSYTIGEQVTYDIVVTLSEGSSNNLVVTDVLPAGMVYVSSAVDATGFDGTVTTAPTVTVAPGDGGDISFSFGDATVNDDNDATNNDFTLHVTVLVTDVATNFQGVSLTNHASMTYDNPLGGTTTTQDISDPVITVIEPRITTTKSVVDSADTGTDASPGEVLTYTARFENTGNSTAYEVNALDTLAPGTEFNAYVGITSSFGAGAPTMTDNGDGTVSITGDWDMAIGDWVEVQYTVTVMAAGFTAGSHTNTVDADWSSRDGADPHERTYADTGNSPMDGTQDEYNAVFTVIATASIGDTVWFDSNNDGAQAGDATEPGISNVRVTLTADVDGDGTPEFTQTVLTGTTGLYTFSNLAAFDNYVITVDHDGGAGAFNLDGAGYSQTADLDGLASAHFATASLTTGENRTDVDFGYTGHNSVGDTVWYDADGNGVLDGNEDGIGGLTVTINADIDGDGTAEYTETTTTDDSGLYSFDHLPAGSYTISVTPPAGSTPTYDQDSGTTSPNNSTPFTLGAAENRDDIDFGLRGTGSLGDTVWFDSNADGVQDGGTAEPGISGVTVTLTGDVDGDGVADYTTSTTTGADGTYSFANLLGGTYTVTVEDATLPGGTGNWQQTFDRDEDGSPSLDHTASAIVLAGGASRNDVDFGYTGTGSLGDRVWWDADRDGVQDAGEIGLSGIEVTINADIDGDGTAEYTDIAITDANGNYLFENLPAASYTTSVTGGLPTGAIPTYDLDSAIVSPDGIDIYTLALGEDIDRVDFGYTGSGSIGNRVWRDTNGDGVQDAGESGIAGVTVTLTSGAITLTTVTDSNGNYLFDGLFLGDYTVTVDDATLPPGSNQTYDLDGTGSANTADVTLTAGSPDRDDVDFGYRQSGTIGDTVWYDMDADGVQDAGELGLAGVTVTLTGDVDGDGTDDTVVVATDSDGRYLFTDLAAGDYTIALSGLPAGMSQTADPDGGNDNASTLTLAGGEVNLDQDFGYTGTGAIGDTIWNDADGDGVLDPGESGYAGVTVTLVADLNNDGTPDTLTTVTDANGNYSFENLPADSYTITVDPATLPPGVVQTYDAQGALDNAATVPLAAGETNNGVDFGYRQSGTIGDTVWYDMDADGVQDAGELGLAGVTVTLTGDVDGDGTDDTVVVTTDSDGRYLFTDLAAGEYTIALSNLPAGMSQTADPDGSNDNASTLTLAGGEVNLDQDFGYTGTGAIGDTIWNDADGDGVLDPGESGYAGVTVTLVADLNNDGTMDTLTTVTDANGNYSFENLPADSYTITVDPATLPPGVVQTYDAQGALDNAATVSLAAGETNNGVDFGYRQSGTIGDTVWYDMDADGVQDAGEFGLANINVTLVGDLDGDGAADDILVTTTDGNGHYLFDRLPAGYYTITVDPATLPGGMEQTHDLDGLGTANTASVTLPANTAVLDVDFGYTGTGSIGDTIWSDVDGDGIQDPGEPGIAGVTVTLTGDFDNDGAADDTITVTTGGSGQYLFDNLPAGSFTVAVTPPSGGTQTGDPDGSPDNTATVVLGPGEDNLDQDFGYRLPPPAQPEPGTPPGRPNPVPPPGIPAVTPAEASFADPLLMYRQFGRMAVEDQIFFPYPESEQPQVPVPISPLYTGHCEPGTTITLMVYDALGNAIGYQTVMADTGGNWLAGFSGTMFHDTPHRMEIIQTQSLYNGSTPGLFNMRTYFNPAMTGLIFSTTRLDIESISAYAAGTVAESLHQEDKALFDLDWDAFSGYEFFSPSINPAQHKR